MPSSKQQPRRIFISSTIRDLSEVRKRISEAIVQSENLPIMAETIIDVSNSPREALRQTLAKCDCYIGIFDKHWGEVPKEDNPRRLSVTAMEYEIAKELRLPRLLLISRVEKAAELEDFLDTISDFDNGQWRRSYTDLVELVGLVNAGIPKLVEATNPTVDNNGAPVLEFELLPHYKGYPLPLKVVTRDLGNGQKQSEITNMGDSAPEVGLLAESQRWGFEWDILAENRKELLIKFAVLRIKCLRGEALDCRAYARIRRIHELGKSYNGDWISAGQLNWFSVFLKREMGNHIQTIDADRGLGVNQYIRNISLDFHQGDEKDLLLFYMIKDNPTVFVCSEVASETAGVTLPDMPLKFGVEIGITAKLYPKNVLDFVAEVLPDDFRVKQVSPCRATSS